MRTDIKETKHLKQGRGGGGEGIGFKSSIQRGRGGCSLGFGIAPRVLEWNLSELFWKVLKKGHFKTKNLKRGPAIFYIFFKCLSSDICEKKSQILVQLACGGHSVFKFKLLINYA